MADVAAERLALATGQMSVPAIVAAVAEAEERGYEAAFVGEGASEADAFVASAAALLATRRIRVGPGVVTVHDRHPAALARGAASLDRLAPGRALLGVGRGDRDQVEEALGLPYSPALPAIGDALAICRDLLDGRRADHDGRRWTAHLGPVPRRSASAGRVPLVLAAVGERTLRLGGALADAVLLNYGAPVEYVAWAVQRIAEGAEAAGRSPADVDVYGSVLLVRTDLPGAAGALDAVRGLLAGLLALPDQGAALAAPAGGPPARWDDAALRRHAVVGDAAACRGRLGEYRAAGLRCPALLPAGMRALAAG